MSINFVGHHGTDASQGANILRCRYFTQSNDEDEWLGRGVYFFSRNPSLAVWWAKDIKKYNPYVIIEVNIEVDEDRILDCSKQEILDELDKWATILNQNRRRSKKYAQKQINDNLVINYIYNNVMKFDLVVGIFDHKSRKAMYRSRLQPYQIQLCVRNHSCIKNISQIV